MFALSIILLVFAALVAVANIGGCIAANRRKQRGAVGGYSNVPFVSLLFCLLAWRAAGREHFGYCTFLPAVLDPGTWSLLLLPFFLWRNRRK
jgi:hypothetical protein